MSEKIAVRTTDISSNQDWASDPDMIEVNMSQDFLDKAEKCVAFMQENDVSYVCMWYVLGYEFYELAENYTEPELEDKTLITGKDGKKYVEFETEYRVEGCHAKIYKDGVIQAVFPIKHSGDQVW